MAMARRVSLFAREVTVKLAPVAVDLIHSAARMLTEGEMTGNLYTGSTMMTVDLARSIDRISDAPDATTALRVAFLYAADERCREHARRIGVAEARKKAGCDLSLPSVDVESRAKGPELHLSINVEAQRRNA